MRLLLDTHVLIWWDEGEELADRAREMIRAANEVYVSAVSAWEIAIKASLGRLRPKRAVSDAIAESGFEELPLLVRHSEALSRLPHEHRDPFDRMLVAQAMTETLTLVTRDPIFRRYRIRTIGA